MINTAVIAGKNILHTLNQLKKTTVKANISEITIANIIQQITAAIATIPETKEDLVAGLLEIESLANLDNEVLLLLQQYHANLLNPLSATISEELLNLSTAILNFSKEANDFLVTYLVEVVDSNQPYVQSIPVLMKITNKVPKERQVDFFKQLSQKIEIKFNNIYDFIRIISYEAQLAYGEGQFNFLLAGNFMHWQKKENNKAYQYGLIKGEYLLKILDNIIANNDINVIEQEYLMACTDYLSNNSNKAVLSLFNNKYQEKLYSIAAMILNVGEKLQFNPNYSIFIAKWLHRYDVQQKRNVLQLAESSVDILHDINNYKTFPQILNSLKSFSGHLQAIPAEYLFVAYNVWITKGYEQGIIDLIGTAYEYSTKNPNVKMDKNYRDNIKHIISKLEMSITDKVNKSVDMAAQKLSNIVNIFIKENSKSLVRQWLSDIVDILMSIPLQHEKDFCAKISALFNAEINNMENLVNFISQKISSNSIANQQQVHNACSVIFNDAKEQITAQPNKNPAFQELDSYKIELMQLCQDQRIEWIEQYNDAKKLSNNLTNLIRNKKQASIAWEKIKNLLNQQIIQSKLDKKAVDDLINNLPAEKVRDNNVQSAILLRNDAREKTKAIEEMIAAKLHSMFFPQIDKSKLH